MITVGFSATTIPDLISWFLDLKALRRGGGAGGVAAVFIIATVCFELFTIEYFVKSF